MGNIMKRLFFIVFLVLCIVLNVFSEQINTIEEQNIYGGRTFERIYDVNEQAQLNYSRTTQYFNSEDKIVKIVATPTNAFIDGTGMREQINYYKNGIIEKYEKFFTEQFKITYCFNRLIEEVNIYGETTRRIWYNNDTLLDISEPVNDRFVFYDIEYMEDEYFRDYLPSETGDVISLSARYFRIKSVVKFSTEFFELDANDFLNMRTLASAFGFQDMAHLYSKKIKVYSNNRWYWLYVQTQLEQYINGQNATIRYYPIGKNKELYLICVGFYDIIELHE
jgi:hypothetical protein